MCGMCVWYVCLCVHVSVQSHMSVFTRACVEGVSLTNLTNHTLFLNEELLHFNIPINALVLAFMSHYVYKSKSISLFDL